MSCNLYKNSSCYGTILFIDKLSSNKKNKSKAIFFRTPHSSIINTKFAGEPIKL